MLAAALIAIASTASDVFLRASQGGPSGSVFTAKQATAGKAVFSKACASCHMPDLSGNNEVPALVGASFMDTWGDRSTKKLYEYMSGAMPPGGPALSAEAYESILAYVLRSNGAGAGPDPLNASLDVPIKDLVKNPVR
jgi:mono/diheme cytochrome c family protein